MSAAVARGTHRLWDDPPWIFDDPFALDLVGEGWEEIARSSRRMVRDAVWRQGHAGVLVRSRYPEDRLELGQFSQYVILSAGLDSFAWRRPEFFASRKLFEIDHPATQIGKKNRLRELGLPINKCHNFVPLDFETHDLSTCLDKAGLNWNGVTLFSWTGSTMYIGAGRIASMLSTVSRCAPGSEIAFSYNQDLEYVDEVGREFFAAVVPRAAEMREPIISSFSPTAMEALVNQCGLVVEEHPTADELNERYCAGRTDGLRPYTLERLIAARRP
jgi:methyltransferase (TIGR00027 family)